MALLNHAREQPAHWPHSLVLEKTSCIQARRCPCRWSTGEMSYDPRKASSCASSRP